MGRPATKAKAAAAEPEQELAVAHTLTRAQADEILAGAAAMPKGKGGRHTNLINLVARHRVKYLAAEDSTTTIPLLAEDVADLAEDFDVKLHKAPASAEVPE